jgi:stage V sporulation protein K
MEDFQKQIGLESVKYEIEAIVNSIHYSKSTGAQCDHTFGLHLLFVGNPGTGKTTIAKLYGELLCSFGILEKGHVVCVTRRDLIGEHHGATEIKTSSAIDDAIGGVLFVDEAHQLVEGDNDTFGKIALQTLAHRLENDRCKFVCILAGYPDAVDKLFNFEEGLKSRISRTFEFKDYTINQLFEIGKLMVVQRQVTFTESAQRVLKSRCRLVVENGNHGNARAIRTLVDLAIKQMTARLGKRIRMGEVVAQHEMAIVQPCDFDSDVSNKKSDAFHSTYAKEKKENGWTATELKNEGYSSWDCAQAGYSAAECKVAGFSVWECKVGGVIQTVMDCRQAGFSVQEVLDAGFSAQECMAAGYSQSGCVNSGHFDPKDSSSNRSTNTEGPVKTKQMKPTQ